jgi:hypothetical protein
MPIKGAMVIRLRRNSQGNNTLYPVRTIFHERFLAKIDNGAYQEKSNMAVIQDVIQQGLRNNFPQNAITMSLDYRVQGTLVISILVWLAETRTGHSPVTIFRRKPSLSIMRAMILTHESITIHTGQFRY